MKKFIILIVSMVALSGCGQISKTIATVGASVNDGFVEADAIGEPTVENFITIWPKMSGQLKGAWADNYNVEFPPVAKSIVGKLDTLAKKNELTIEEKGFVIGSYCRLQFIIAKEAWNKYGVKLTSFF